VGELFQAPTRGAGGGEGMKIAALLVALAVLALTAASAECAWVLWGQSVQGGKKPEWPISEAYQDQPACEAGMRDIIDLFRRSASKMYEIVGESMVIVHQDGKLIISFSFSCLPDTVDPRSPKGGQ
jgi:hypothetical protein